MYPQGELSTLEARKVALRSQIAFERECLRAAPHCFDPGLRRLDRVHVGLRWVRRFLWFSRLLVCRR